MKMKDKGGLSGSVVEHLPSAQVMIPGSWDRVLHPWGSVLSEESASPCPSDLSPHSCSFSLTFSQK